VLACGLWAWLAAPLWAQTAQRPQPLQSGVAFAGAEVRALQRDEFANPAMLWVERGRALWEAPAGREQRACAGCHGALAGMQGVATRYPQVDAGGRLVNLEERIRQCRERRQHAPPFEYESDALLGLTALVRLQSRGLPMNVAIDAGNRAFFERGRDFYNQRVGQMNLACAHCHQDNWGRRLGAETISQGHATAYPAYRLEWQSIGSLQRRFRSCLSGVRAEMLPYGAAEYLELELFLAWRGGDLPLEAPGVRR
jgi:sulfur-oxidizing protein SoxA